MPLKYAANLTMLYNEIPFLDRFAKASKAGFSAVEFLSPYDAGIESVKVRLEDHGLTVALFNLPPGDSQRGEWGTLSLPTRTEYFRSSFSMALETARTFKCKRLNLMFGKKADGIRPEAQIACAMNNIAWALPQAVDAGVILLIEPLNAVDFPTYFIQSTLSAMKIIAEINHPQLRLQYDVYHAQMTEGHLIDTIKTYFSWIAHIQIADVPGRHQPSTGEINYPYIFGALEQLGYSGYIGLEYKPLGATDESFSWLSLEARAYKGK
jgi:hydroxypyruvate isomerase